MAKDLPVIGIVGLGNMGGPMCLRLVAAGYPVVAYDLNADALAWAVAGGARAGASAADCAAQADVFLTSLPRPDHVEKVMATALPALRAGSLWVDLPTNRRELLARYLAEAPKGVEIIDSPVTGAVDGARHGMDRVQLERFIQHYERTSRHLLATLPATADRVIRLDEARRPVAA